MPHQTWLAFSRIPQFPPLRRRPRFRCIQRRSRQSKVTADWLCQQWSCNGSMKDPFTKLGRMHPWHQPEPLQPPEALRSLSPSRSRRWKRRSEGSTEPSTALWPQFELSWHPLRQGSAQESGGWQHEKRSWPSERRRLLQGRPAWPSVRTASPSIQRRRGWRRRRRSRRLRRSLRSARPRLRRQRPRQRCVRHVQGQHPAKAKGTCNLAAKMSSVSSFQVFEGHVYSSLGPTRPGRHRSS
mmetsp:Transcript_59371/g.173665  ORF Transcript_59371/g.173665 Transcript_59371/m.173665 type:complete len:240 (-) Transcript_59371:80-799(-)